MTEPVMRERLLAAAIVFVLLVALGVLIGS